MRFDEKEALLQIKEGKKLEEFSYNDYEWAKEPMHWPTRLMILAALTYHGKKAYLEIPKNGWTQRAAKMAVTADYHAISVIPDELKQHCAKAFTEHYLKQDRKGLDEYKRVFKEQTDIFRNACIGYNPGLSDNKNEFLIRLSKKNMKQKVAAPKAEIGNYGLDFNGDEEFYSEAEMTPDKFLSLPTQAQTKELLLALLNSDMDFPGDFIKKISIPRRNAMYYEKAGDHETAEYWKSKILLYLDKDLCMLIADKHPEAALSATPYLTADAVQRFWDRKKETCSPKEMTVWFLKFPESVLNESMRSEVMVNRAVLKHAPNLFKGSDEARKHLLRSPNDVLYLPEYQTPGFILLDGVNLNKSSVELIENESFREKVKIALNIA